MDSSRKLFGQLFIERGIITHQQVEEAVHKQQTSMAHRRVGEILLRMGAISKNHITEGLADQLDIPIIKISNREIPGHILKQLPREMAILYRVLPLDERGADLVLATADPTNSNSFQHIQRYINRTISAVLATPEEVAIALNKYYGLQDRYYGL